MLCARLLTGAVFVRRFVCQVFNVIQFWIQDNFLMNNDETTKYVPEMAAPAPAPAPASAAPAPVTVTVAPASAAAGAAVEPAADDVVASSETRSLLAAQ
jgi:hypothetical protein